jgi:tRNA1Val (adenine37-N6)-methyltransferase
VKGEGVTIDGLRRFGLQVAQPTDGYRFSLDALLLADFATEPDTGRIVDLGTGCGIIPLVLCRRLAGVSVVGIENNGMMAECARKNVARNGLTDRIETIFADIVALKSLFPVSSFDGVVANPPFRTPVSGRVSPKAGRDTARHESTAGIADFLSVAKYLVKPSGRIGFVYHPDRLAEFIHCAAGLKLALLRLRMVHGTADAPAKIFLAELAKGRKGATTVLPPLIVYDDDGSYTPEMCRILGTDDEKTVG